MISVDSEKCVGCGVCESVCPAGIFKLVNGRASVSDEESCIHCKNCENSCPAGCIKVGDN